SNLPEGLDAAATLLRLNRRKGPGDRSMEEEESRPFGLKWRLIRWNRLRIWVGLRDPGVAQPHQPWGDVLEVNRDAPEREGCAPEQLLSFLAQTTSATGSAVANSLTL